MSDVVVKQGYPAASVAQVIAHAGVSRPTFYGYFPDRESCFLAAHQQFADMLIERVRSALASQAPARPLHAALDTLVEFACGEPTAARFLMHETSTAGGQALRARDVTIAKLARLVEHRHRRAGTQVSTPDLFVPALIGSLYRVLALRLRRGERDHNTLRPELGTWLAAYERPTQEHRWDSLDQLPGLTLTSRPATKSSLYPPPPLPSGRAALKPEEVAYNHRERILFACLTVSAEKGFTSSSVADIATAARIDKRVFYQHFRDKQDAFHATLEHAFQPTIAVTATAFFNAPTWPERVWAAGGAFTAVLAANHALAHFAFVDSYTVGPTAVHRSDDLRAAFTIFLQEGRQHMNGALAPPTETAFELIAATVFEFAYNQISRGRAHDLPRLLPHVTHLCLTPFLGSKATEEFIDEKLAQAGSKPG